MESSSLILILKTWGWALGCVCCSMVGAHLLYARQIPAFNPWLLKEEEEEKKGEKEKKEKENKTGKK